MAKTAKKDAKKLLEEARDRYKRAVEADQENRRLALEDLKFAHEPGAQWEDSVKSERGNRPCYEFNGLRVTIKRIVNAIRANRPQGKVRAVEDGDKDTADTLEGLIRNIWTVSDGDAAVDGAADYQVAGGFGAWRIVTEYADDSAWDLDIRIKGIPNPFCVFADPAAQDPMRRDARYWFLTSKLSKEAFEQKYGDVPVVEFESSEFDDEEWSDEDSVRIAEYWYRKPVTKQLVLLADGKTVDLAVDQPPPEMIVRTRAVQSWQICMIVMSGDRILEGPVEWPGAHFPFVPVYGEQLTIDGKRQWFGMVRHSKDAMRAGNVAKTSIIETVALSPQAKYWATPKQAEGHLDKWSVAHKENLPVQLFNPDPANPGPPQRMGGADVPVALMQIAQMADEDLKRVTGVYDPQLSGRTNATSGVAKRAEIAQGEIANFAYQDNIARAIRRTWEILIDLVPRIYDTERSIRILGNDGAERYVKVNAPGPNGEVMNDLSRGKFDVQVTVGPNFSTQRQEALEMYTALSQANPAIAAVAGDLMMKLTDSPYSEEMAERMRTILPPQVQQQLAQKEQQGKALPPEAQAAMAQAQQAMQMVQQQGQMVQAAAAEAEGMKAEAEKAVAQIQAEQAKLAADFERMKAEITKREAALVLKEAQLTMKAATDDVAAGEERGALEAERQDVTAMVAQATAEMQANVAQFMEAAAQAIIQIQQTTAEASAAVQPRPQAFDVTRDPDGSLVARSANKEIRLKRKPGGGGFDSTVTPLQ